MGEQKPLYCFRLEEDFSITRIMITEYTARPVGDTGRTHYTWTSPKVNKTQGRYYLSSSKLNRFVTDKVFTFDPDLDHAFSIMLKRLESDVTWAHLELNKATDKYNKFILKQEEIKNGGC